MERIWFVEKESDSKYETSLAIFPISSSYPRPPGAAYLLILLSRKGGMTYRERRQWKLVFAAAWASVHKTDMPHISWGKNWKHYKALTEGNIFFLALYGLKFDGFMKSMGGKTKWYKNFLLYGNLCWLPQFHMLEILVLRTWLTTLASNHFRHEKIL